MLNLPAAWEGILSCCRKRYLKHGAGVHVVGTDRPSMQMNDLLRQGKADLDEILTTAFVLNMDSKLLCRPDCKGICPRCGKNLNEGACSCRPEIDPRLAVLGQLLKDK